jgi:hypothetical protein
LRSWRSSFARHRHLNSFEDILSDGRSDSGVFVESGWLPDPKFGSAWTPARVIDDDPCIACFHNDWATEPIEFLALTPRFSPASLAPAHRHVSALPALTRSGQPRAPPTSV